jgi:hypothetical protein
MSLVGFGLGSGIESAAAVLVGLRLAARLRRGHADEAKERRTLKAVAVTFYLLARPGWTRLPGSSSPCSPSMRAAKPGTASWSSNTITTNHADRSDTMAADWLTCAIIIAVASPTFGHFETVRPVWTRVARWLFYLAVTAVIGADAGRPYTFIWIFGLPAAAAVFHVTGCLRHGINLLTAEPRERYEQLRQRRPHASKV